jgi:hypothetical protein
MLFFCKRIFSKFTPSVKQFICYTRPFFLTYRQSATHNSVRFHVFHCYSLILSGLLILTHGKCSSQSRTHHWESVPLNNAALNISSTGFLSNFYGAIRVLFLWNNPVYQPIAFLNSAFFLICSKALCTQKEREKGLS